MNQAYPGIRLHLGYYGPRTSDEPIAAMKPRLAGHGDEQPAPADATPAGQPRRSRVEIRTETNP